MQYLNFFNRSSSPLRIIFPGRDNIEIAFMYSQCGEDWKQVLMKKFNANEACFNFLLSHDIEISNNPWPAGGELN